MGKNLNVRSEGPKDLWNYQILSTKGPFCSCVPLMNEMSRSGGGVQVVLSSPSSTGTLDTSVHNKYNYNEAVGVFQTF